MKIEQIAHDLTLGYLQKSDKSFDTIDDFVFEYLHNIKKAKSYFESDDKKATEFKI